MKMFRVSANCERKGQRKSSRGENKKSTLTPTLKKKTIPPSQKTPLTFPLDRDDMERDLTFQGLIIFRNELRDDSAATIAKLKVSAEICFSLCS